MGGASVQSPVIFEDSSGRRRRWAIAALALMTWLVVLPWAFYQVALRAEPHLPRLSAPEVAAPAHVPTVRPRAAFVFAAHDDPPGARSIDAHAEQIDTVVPDWFRLPGAGCQVEETLDDASRRWAKEAKMRVVARVANLREDSWAKAEGGALLHDEAARRCVARRVASRARALGARGINVDLESLSPKDAHGLVSFLTELREALGPGDLLTIDVTPDDPAYDLERLTRVADAIIVMAYDEHEETSAPGPIASPGWFAGVVDRAMARIPRERLVIGMGSYCYDWTLTRPRHAEALGFGAAMERAALSSGLPTFERANGGTEFSYAAGGSKHEVWCADAAAVQNQTRALAARGLQHWALWRAGSEDPSLWEGTAMAPVPPGNEAAVVGDGAAWTRSAPPTPGFRDVTLADDGSVLRATYRTLPSGGVFQRRGDNDARGIVLTFDDGPDERTTPIILDTLRQLHAPATFFVLGEQVMRHPDLARRIAQEGHLVGNHTYHHPHIDRVGEDALRGELLETERALEGLLGRYSPLFRAPYTARFDARDPGLLATHRPAFDAGYAVVGADIDPLDWSTPGAEIIAERIVAGAENGGHIVLLHDAGGERSQTIDALRIALPRLRARGFHISSMDEHLGVARTTLAASLDRRDAALATGARVLALVTGSGPSLLGVLFVTCTVIAALRVALLVLLAVRRRKRERERSGAEMPRVSVVIPAYNEEKVIGATIQALLASDYEALEIVVVDDGSTDGTFAEARAIAMEDLRVRCLRKPNEGKARAANHGVAYARGDIVVSVDADTIVAPDAIRHLVSHFVDPEVAAVCGNVEVGNVSSVLTMFQGIEYVTSQNIDRAALAELNAISVVPGALGAWRRDVLLDVGGYAGDTLVEDADLTLSVLRAGYRIAHEPRAIARTEAPETLGALWKQRFRWTYGTYQCMAKHGGALLQGGAGKIALPNMILFQLVFPLLAPLGDLGMVLAIMRGEWAVLLGGYLGFLAMDFASSIVAFRLDRKPFRWLPLLVVQRFTYRQFLYLLSLRAVVAAIAGRAHGWRKLERTGAVTTPWASREEAEGRETKLAA